MDETVPVNDAPPSSSSCDNHWFFSRDDIEKNSPSRLDGIDSDEETRLRKEYYTFLKRLGAKLILPPKTIATAIVYCHRFFLRQSHAKNDKFTIAMACMFLAGKVEETFRFSKELIVASHELLEKKILTIEQRKEVYKQQKDFLINGEKLLLATMNFDLNVGHPFIHLVEAIKTYVADEANFPQVREVAVRFIGDCHWTTLRLQHKPRQIAIGAFLLAAQKLEVVLRSTKEALCQNFEITDPELKDIQNQILELYVHKETPSPQGNIFERSKGGGDMEAEEHEPVARDKCQSSDIVGSSSSVALRQSDNHSEHDRCSRPEGIEKESEVSEREVRDEDDETMKKGSESLLKADSNTNAEAADANLTGVADE
ncbi:unnamed protein product [Cochlearia groenlandica]